MPENILPIIPSDLSTGPTPSIPNDRPMEDTGMQVDFQTGIPMPNTGPSAVSPTTPEEFDIGKVMGGLVSKNSVGAVPGYMITPQQQANRYNQFNPLLDNEELAAQGQSSLEQAGHGLVKMGALAVTSFANGMMSIPDQIRGIRGGNVYQNEWSQDLDDWAHSLEDRFPNYYSQWQKENPFASAMPFSEGGANFWFDKVLKNTGYTIGAIGSALLQDAVIGGLTGAIGSTPLIANQVGKAALWMNKMFTGGSRLDDVLMAASQLKKNDQTLLRIAEMAQHSAGTKVLNGARYMATMYGASHTEAAMEARMGYNEVRDDLIQEYRTKNGYDPTGTDLTEIEEAATGAANTRYGVNLALLTISNAIQFEHILKPFAAFKREVAQGVSGSMIRNKAGVAIGTADKPLTAEVIGVVSRESTKGASGVLGALGAAGGFVKPIIPNILSEGILEEGLQFATEQATSQYFKDKYNGKIRGEVSDVLSSAVHGLSQQFGTSAGWENMMIGGITGAIFSPVSNKIKSMKDVRAGILSESEAMDRAINILNAQGITGIFEQNVDNMASAVANRRSMEQAIQEGNIFKFQNLKAEEFYNFIMSGIQAGKFDVRLEQLRMLKELPQEEINKLFGLEDTDRQNASVYIDHLITRAERIRKGHDAISSVFNNPFQYAPNATTEEGMNSTRAYLAFEEYKNALSKFAFRVEDFNSRTADITQELAAIQGGLSTDTLMQVTRREGLDEMVDDYRAQAESIREQLKIGGILPAEAKRMRAQMKAYDTYAQRISNLLNADEFDEVGYASLFGSLMDFELSNHDPKARNVLPREYAVDLIIKGKDLNKISQSIDVTQESYDFITTAEGQKSFMQNYEAWKKGMNLSPWNKLPDIQGAEPVTPATVINTKWGEFEVGRTYAHPDQKTGALSSITILGTTSNGKIRIENANGEVEVVDPSILKKYVPKATEAEQLQKVGKDILKEQQETMNQSGKQPTGDNEADLAATPAPKAKDASWFFTSTAEVEEQAGQVSNDPKVRKRRAFFSRAATFPNRENLRAILVTKANEDALGLGGLSAYSMGNNAANFDYLDVDKGLVMAVYVEKDGAKLYYVDENGKRIGQVGQPIDPKSVVFSTMPTTATKNAKGKDRFRPEQEEEFLAYRQAWREYRTNLFKNTSANAPIASFDLSRGLAVKTQAKQPIEGTILPSSRIEDQGVIEIVKNAAISFNGQQVGFPNGRPVLKWGDTLEFLNNRKLTPKEQEVIYQLLLKYADDMLTKGKVDPRVKDFLANILYWGKLNNAKATGRNQIFIDDQFNLILGGIKVRFTPSEIRKAEATIKGELANIYNNVNDKTLTERFTEPFEEVVSVEKDGSLVTRQWKSYQHYLLSSKNPDGSKRSTDELPLFTFVRPVDPNIPGDSNFIQKYAILQGLDLPPVSVKKKLAFKPPAPSGPVDITKVQKYDSKTAPIIDMSLVDLVTSGMGDMPGLTITRVKLLEVRGRNASGQLVGTIMVTGRTEDGLPFNDTFEVMFNEVSPSTPARSGRHTTTRGEIAYTATLSADGKNYAVVISADDPATEAVLKDIVDNTLSNPDAMQVIEEKRSVKGEAAIYEFLADRINTELIKADEAATDSTGLASMGGKLAGAISASALVQVTKEVEQGVYWTQSKDSADDLLSKLPAGYTIVPKQKTVKPQGKPEFQVDGFTIIKVATPPTPTKAKPITGTHKLTTGDIQYSASMGQDGNYEVSINTNDAATDAALKAMIAKVLPNNAIMDKVEKNTGSRDEAGVVQFVKNQINTRLLNGNQVPPAPAAPQAPVSDIDRIKSLPFQNRITALQEAGLIGDKGMFWGGRWIILTYINGQVLPFYRSAHGTDGKQKGKWFPMFGFGYARATDTEMSWLVKGSHQDLENHFGVPVIGEMSDLINETLSWDHTVDQNQSKLSDHPFLSGLETMTESELNQLVYNTPDPRIINDGGPSLEAAFDVVRRISGNKPVLGNPAVTNVKGSVQAPNAAAPITRSKFKGRTPGNPQYSIAESLQVQRMDEQELNDFREWHQANVPGIPFEVLDHMIATHDNRMAWGVFEGGVARFYRSAAKGTEYHEIFEGIWNAMLFQDERSDILSEFRSREGSYRDRESGSIIRFADATDHQAKEKIADEFADYRLKRLPARSFTDKLIELFNRIVTFFKSFIEKPSLKDELFRKIDTGGFRDYSLTPEAANIDPQYSVIPGMSPEVMNAAVQAMSVRAVLYVLDNAKSVFAISEERISDTDIFNHIKQDYIDWVVDDVSQYEALGGDETWDQLVTRTKNYLRTMNVSFDEDNSLNINSEGVNNRDYAAESFTTDAKKSAPSALKLILSTLIETQGSRGSMVGLELPKPKTGASGDFSILNASRVFVTLINEMAYAPTLDEMIKRLVGLYESDPNYVRLFARLGGNTTNGDINFDKISSDDTWRLLIQFYQTFAKQTPETVLLHTGDNGTHTASANQATASKNQQRAWISNMITAAENRRPRTKGDTGPAQNLISKTARGYKVDAAIRGAVTGTQEGQAAFLNALGIPFPVSILRKLNGKMRDRVATEIAAIKQRITLEEVKTLSANTLDIVGPLRKLADIYVKATRPIQESTFVGADGEKRQMADNHNGPSYFQSLFNSAPNVDSVRELIPMLGGSFATNSVILKQGGLFFKSNGEKRDNHLTISLAGGMLISGRAKGKSMGRLTLPERTALELNHNLDGNYYILIPADSSTEYMMNVGNNLPFRLTDDTLKNETYDIYSGYLRDEIALAMEDRKHLDLTRSRAKDLRFFKDILSPAMRQKTVGVIDGDVDIETFMTENDEALRRDVENYANILRDRQRKMLEKQHILRRNPDGTYRAVGLQDSFFTKEKDLNGKPLNRNALTEDQVNQLARFFAVNYSIANTEMHKVLFGDPYQFKISDKTDKKGRTKTILDEVKRVKSWMSPRKSTFDHPAFNNYLNATKNANLVEGDPGFHRFKPYMNTVTIKDSEVMGTLTMSDLPKSVRDIYAETNEADAQAWKHIGAYREDEIKNGMWSPQAEAWYQWEMAYTRKELSKKGVYTYSSPSLQEADRELTRKPAPEFVLHVKKPITSGPKWGKPTELVLDKTSEMPLFYSAVKGKAFEEVFIKMWKEGIDLLMMESGRKVGSEGKHNMYNEDGSINKEPFNNLVQVPWTSRGIQVENQYSEEKKQTRGSQITKLVTLDLIENGVPIDFKGTLSQWNALSEAEMRQASRLYNKVSRNKSILDEMTQWGYIQLQKKLGIVDNGGIKVIDREKLSKVLIDEMGRRGVSDNIREALSIDPTTGDFVAAIEATPAYTTVRNILYSFVDKTILSPKMNGRPMVQVSALGWEDASNGRGLIEVYRENGKPAYRALSREEYNQLPDERKKNVRLSSTDLKFYTKEEPWIEVLLPNWFRNKLPAKLKDLNDQDLITYLNSTDGGKKILMGIGFRIPTQGHNSMEVFKVKGFLHPSMGDTVVVPSEITTKSGSDFDIDKLNTYLKNIYIDKNGDVQVVQRFEDRQYHNSFYSEVFFDNLERRVAETQERMKRDWYKFGVAQSLFHDFATPAIRSKWEPIIMDMIGDDEDIFDVQERLQEKVNRGERKLEELNDSDFQEVLLDKFLDKTYKEGLENEYFDSLQELLQLPENFERLVTPNSNGQIPGLADELDELWGTELPAKGVTALLSQTYMTNMRHAFLTGKNWVGIAAVNNTGHSLYQKTPTYLDPSKLKSIPGSDKQWLRDVSIQLPHNTIQIEKEVNGQVRKFTYPSLSGVRDKDGNFISDSFSSWLNAVVDISKDPFVMRVITHPNLIGTFMFLTHLGVPMKTMALFMNQPIIRMYMAKLDEEGSQFMFNDRKVKELLESRLDPVSREALNKNQRVDVGMLEDNIRNFRDGKPTMDNIAQQHVILMEMLKYAKMAEHSLRFTQGTNYDTASFQSGAAYHRKQLRTERAIGSNIITSAEDVMKTAHIQVISERLADARVLIANILKFESPVIREALDSVLNPYGLNNFLSDRDFQKLDNKLTSSFLDYMVQSDTGLGRRVRELLVDPTTAIGPRLEQAKLNHPDDPLLSIIDIIQDQKRGSTINVKLLRGNQDAAESDLITNYLREMRDHEDPEMGALYGDIVRIALLQGVGHSPISFTQLIPIEDYVKVLNPILQKLDTSTLAQDFVKSALFQRNNWGDEMIVPTVEPKFFVNDDAGIDFDRYGNEITSYMSYTFPTMKAFPTGHLITLNEKYQSKEAGMEVVKLKRVVPSKLSTPRNKEWVDILTGKSIFGHDYAEAIRKGDNKYNDFIGYQLVRYPKGHPLEGQPLTTMKGGTLNYVYKMVNLYGNGQYSTEYSYPGSPSVVGANTYKVDQEIPDAQIVAVYDSFKNSNNPKVEDKVEEQAPPTPDAPSASPKFKPITEMKRASKKSNKVISTTENGKESFRQVEGYTVTVEGHPNLKLFVSKDEDGDWSVTEETTGSRVGDYFTTAKEAMENAKERLNTSIEKSLKGDTTALDILAKIGVAEEQDVVESNKEKVGFKPGPCPGGDDDAPF